MAFVNSAANLNLAHWTGAAWQTDPIGSAVASGTSPSGWSDTSGNPFVAFVNSAANLNLAHWTGAAWQTDPIGSAVASGTNPSGWSDTSGNPFVAFVSAANLNLAHWTGAAWQTDPIGSGVRLPGAPPPAVTAVTPSGRGQGAHRRTLTVTGDNFQAGATVSVSGSGVSIATPTSVTASQIQTSVTVASAAAPGARDVTVVNPDGGAVTCTGCFTVDPGPWVSSVAPTVVTRGTSVTATIDGTNFVHGMKIKFGPGTTVTSVVLLSNTELTAQLAVAPNASPGYRTITVMNKDGGTSKKPKGLIII
ncbi:MAG: hypothetical protein ACJ735_16735 [Actinomycetes bacterium]